jgi:DNA polymerase III subunit epsilon
MILIDKGRNISERSAVLIENGIYRGFAFYELNYQITNPSILHNILNPMQNNRDAKNIIQSYMRKSKTIKIINF